MELTTEVSACIGLHGLRRQVVDGHATAWQPQTQVRRLFVRSDVLASSASFKFECNSSEDTLVLLSILSRARPCAHQFGIAISFQQYVELTTRLIMAPRARWPGLCY